MSKVAEKIISKRLRHNLQQHHIPRNEQCGFRPHHSSTTQLMRHVEQITRGFNEKRATVGFYLDIRQAFNKVWHEGLIYKLTEANVDDTMTQLIHSYLQNRTFHVTADNETSNTHPINSGVPQGSVLSPTLFNIYINDIPHHHHHNNSSLHIFTDDTLITGQSKHPTLAAQQVQRNITHLEEWLANWKILINHEKCQAVLYIRRTSLLTNLPPSITTNGNPIPWSTKATYLGVTLDTKLTFAEHINTALRKAHGQLRLITPMINPSSKLPPRIKITIYKSLLRPILTYASPVWAHAAKRHIKKIQTFQNTTLYKPTGLPRYTPLTTLHHEAGVERIDDYLRSASCQFFLKCQEHTNPLIQQLGCYNIANDKRNRPTKILPQALLDDLTPT